MQYDIIKENINKACDDIVNEIESIRNVINTDIDLSNIESLFRETKAISRSISGSVDLLSCSMTSSIRSEIRKVAGRSVSRNIITDRAPLYANLIKLDYVGLLELVQRYIDDDCESLEYNCIHNLTPQRTINFVHDQKIIDYLSSLWKTEIHRTSSRSIKYYPGDTILYIMRDGDKFRTIFYTVDAFSCIMTYQLYLPYHFDIGVKEDDRFYNFDSSLKVLSVYQKLAKTKMPKSRFETFKKIDASSDIPNSNTA